MSPDELRCEALRQAAIDAKHQSYANNSMNFSGSGPPDADSVVIRAKTYLAFLYPPSPKPRRVRK